MIATLIRRSVPRLLCSAAVAAGTLLAGPAWAKELVVGFSQIGAESAWRTAETNSIREEAARRGINLKFSDAQQKQENQIKALRAFMAQRVDAIVLAPVVETGWEPVLRQIKAKGIPVILADRAVNVSDESLYTTLITSDMLEQGRRAGRWLAEKTDGKCTIVELQGTSGSAPANDRQKGFAEAIAAYPEMKIILSQTGEFTRAKGKEVMEAFLKAKGREINAVFAHNDDMALGAIQAIEAAGLKPGTDIIIVSIDGVRDALQAIVDGKLNCSVECSPLLGGAIFDAVEKAVAKEEHPKKVISEETVFDASNAAAALPNRKY